MPMKPDLNGSEITRNKPYRRVKGSQGRALQKKYENHKATSRQRRHDGKTKYETLEEAQAACSRRHDE